MFPLSLPESAAPTLPPTPTVPSPCRPKLHDIVKILAIVYWCPGLAPKRWSLASCIEAQSFLSACLGSNILTVLNRRLMLTEMTTKQEEELSLFELVSAKLSDAQKLMAEARDLLKPDHNNARQEKSAIEEITKTLNEVHFASTIKLNVGGKIYQTTPDTLRKDPDSMLCAMFSGRFELKANEVNGAYFIDRDGKLFRYVYKIICYQ